MAKIEVERLEVTAPGWGFTMNAYIVRDSATGNVAIVDPGAEPERILAAAGDKVSTIWITHADWDHVDVLEEVHAATGAPVLAHPLEVDRLPVKADILVSHGYEFFLGESPVQVLLIPGHSPGHIAFVIGRHVLGGDILFPRGPGHTNTPETFQQLVSGIATHLLILDDDIVVHPGHGAPITVGAARKQYKTFVRRNPPADLFGDVTWSGM